MTNLDGCDYSRTPHSNWEGIAAALKAAGKTFVGRYAVSDLSPTGRGISAAEYAAMKAAGVEVFVFWEGVESWMLGGYAAGQNAARNAESCLANAGMPPGTPIYFAHDIDPSPAHWAAIDACLNGAAAVVGWERVGVYGGWALIDYMAGGGTVKLLCQTSAWEYGRGLHPAACLYQYAYNQYFAGVNCDLVRAVKPTYGQASLYEPKPAPQPEPSSPPVPVYPAPRLPSWWAGQKALQFPVDRQFSGATWVAARRKSVVLRPTAQRLTASSRGKTAGPMLQPGAIVHVERLIKAADGQVWAVLRAGGPGVEGARVRHDDLKDTPDFPGDDDATKG